MAKNLKHYDATEVSVAFAGIPINSGYADGEFLSIEQNAADFEIKVGTDGQVTRFKTNNHSAKIKLKLHQSSDSNAALSAINQLDRAGQNGAGVGPLLIKDRQGTSLYTASKCWISKPPVASFAREVMDREWELECADLIRLDGGN